MAAMISSLASGKRILASAKIIFASAKRTDTLSKQYQAIVLSSNFAGERMKKDLTSGSTSPTAEVEVEAELGTSQRFQ